MRRLRSGALIGLVIVVSALATFATPAPSARADASDTQFFLAKINALRAEAGLPPMTIEPELQALAEQWAPVMASTYASTQQLVHPHVTDGITVPYIWVGDNIAFGPTNEDVWNQFDGSPVHHTNLVDPRFDRVGIGVAVANGSRFVITRFLASAPEVEPTEPPQEEPVAPPPSTDTTEPAPEVVVVLGEAEIRPVNMAVIPAVRYGIPPELAAPADQPNSSSNLPALLLALAVALLLLLAAGLVIQSRRRAATS